MNSPRAVLAIVAAGWLLVGLGGAGCGSLRGKLDSAGGAAGSAQGGAAGMGAAGGAPAGSGGAGGTLGNAG